MLSVNHSRAIKRGACGTLGFTTQAHVFEDLHRRANREATRVGAPDYSG